MPEPRIPPLRRLFALRQFTTFTNVDLSELAVVADNVRETHFAPGEEIAPADARLRALHLVLRGRIEARNGGVIETWGPRDVFGMLEVLAGRAVSAPAISISDTQTLALGAVDTHEILENNFGVLHAVIGGLAARLLENGGLPTSQALELPATGLTLVERVILLRQHAPFAGGTASARGRCTELRRACMAGRHAGRAGEPGRRPRHDHPRRDGAR